MIRVIEEVDGEVEKSHADYVAVIARPFDVSKCIAIEFRHDAENKIAFGSGRSQSTRLRGSPFAAMSCASFIFSSSLRSK